MPVNEPLPLSEVVSPPLVETRNPNEEGERHPGDPTISLNPDGTVANAVHPLAATTPINPEPTPLSDPAHVPSPYQQVSEEPAEEARRLREESLQAENRMPPGSTPTPAATPTSPAPAATTSVEPGSSATTPSETATPAAAKTPNITSIAPESAFANHDLDLVVTGTDIVMGAQIQFAGAFQATIVTDSTSAKATVLASTLPNPGTLAVSIVNPDGSKSNEVEFTAT